MKLEQDLRGEDVRLPVELLAHLRRERLLAVLDQGNELPLVRQDCVRGLVQFQERLFDRVQRAVDVRDPNENVEDAADLAMRTLQRTASSSTSCSATATFA